jgi:hypothetical protein
MRSLSCRILEITVLDHIIITSESYFSFADEGSCSASVYNCCEQEIDS